MSEKRLLTLAEVSQHSKDNDLYLVYKNRVFDITSFLDEHPGGVEVIRDFAGKDATEAFDQVGHSEDAHEQMEELLIGRLDAKDTATLAITGDRKKFKSGSDNTIVLYGFVFAICATLMAGLLVHQN